MIGYTKQTRICLLAKISGDGKWLPFLACTSLNKELFQNCGDIVLLLLWLFSLVSLSVTQQQSDPVLLQSSRLCSLWVAPDQIDYSWRAQFIWVHFPPTLLLLLVWDKCIVCVCVCVCSVYVICQFVLAKLQICSGGYSIQQVMMLLLTDVLKKLFALLNV